MRGSALARFRRSQGKAMDGQVRTSFIPCTLRSAWRCWTIAPRALLRCRLPPAGAGAGMRIAPTTTIHGWRCESLVFRRPAQRLLDHGANMDAKPAHGGRGAGKRQHLRMPACVATTPLTLIATMSKIVAVLRTRAEERACHARVHARMSIGSTRSAAPGRVFFTYLPTARTVGHGGTASRNAEVIFTSAAIAPAAFWRLVGALRFRAGFI